MTYGLLFKLAAGMTALVLVSGLAAAEPPPATAPATQPARFAIRGRVSLEESWSLRKPNLARVAVYLASNPTLDTETTPAKSEVTQYRKAFDPDFLLIPRGTEVEFPNYDRFSHNVFSRSRAAPPFDLDRFPFGYSKSRRFDSPGVIHIFCNIHPQMHGMIVVAPNSIFARADADGRFELPPVPAGQYTLIAWYERSGEQSQPVSVGADGRIPDVSIVLKENRDSVLANVPPDHGSAYGIERGLGIKREQLDLPVVKDAHPVAPPPPNKQ